MVDAISIDNNLRMLISFEFQNDHLDCFYYREEIEKSVRFCSNANGVFRLLHKLICKQPGWIKPFIEAIRYLGYRAIDDGTSSNMSLADLLDDYCGWYLFLQ